MTEYVPRDRVLEIIKRTSGDYAAAWADVNKLTAADVVSRSFFDQINWERGVAVEQLNQVGKSLGEDMGDLIRIKHGKWNSLTDCSNAGVYCSVCHKKVWKEDYAWCNRKNKLRSNFCPHCGARMLSDDEAEWG